MSSPCAGCGVPSDAFATTFKGKAIELCDECAARLAAGESKKDVIEKSTQEAKVS